MQTADADGGPHRWTEKKRQKNKKNKFEK